jgi:hypothetical protein
MLDDGVYGLSFESRAPSEPGEAPALSGASEQISSIGQSEGLVRSEGLAVLRGGRILGSDPYGGVFRGHYQYDAARGDILVEVRLAIPPNGVLLTGLEAGPDGAFVDVSGRFPKPKPVSSAVVDVAGAPVTVELRFVGALSS